MEDISAFITVAWIMAAVALMVCIAVYDVRHRLVLNSSLLILLCLRGVALGFALCGGMNPDVWGPKALAWSCAGAVCAAGCLWIVSWFIGRGDSEEALGFGDIKLVACQGLCLSPFLLVFSLFISSIIGLVWALITKFVSKQSTFPFAPSLCIGFCFALLPASGYLPIL